MWMEPNGGPVVIIDALFDVALIVVRTVCVVLIL